MVKPIKHGTVAGYTQHRRKKIPMCEECRVAQREYDRAYHKANREKRNAGTLAYYAANREKALENQRAYYEANRERILKKMQASYDPAREREKQLVAKYGLTTAEYDQMVMVQCGTCSICGEPASSKKRVLAVDHDHDTGEVRGLLCSNCNTGIGNLRDSPELLNRAVAYLGGG